MSRICRSFAVLMALVLVMAALSACGSDNKPAPLVKANSDLNGKTVAVFFSEFAYDTKEYDSITEALKNSGAKVIVTSTTMRLIDVIEGYTYMDQVDPKAVDAILFLGGDGNYKYLGHDLVQNFVKKCGTSGKLIGAIGSGTTLLADAGITKGKKVTGPPDAKKQMTDSGATFTGKSVEEDGNLVTAVSGKEKDFLKQITALLNPAKK